MNPSDWQEVFRHFDALCELPADQRKQALEALALSDAIRDQIDALLADDGAADLGDIADRVLTLSQEVNLTDRIGQQVGPYRLERLLGEGGMGEVYLGRRVDGRFDADVAIKFPAVRSARGERLFDRERRVLARLNHPDIARLIDAGEHERFGAYLVMEFVDGRPLSEVVASDSPDPQTILSWIRRTAGAVAHAHQNLILHRDLKPDHLLLCADGQVKVLDFGVAGLLEGHADGTGRTTHQSFTPRYAAPEQLLGQSATTGTDVYALGSVLFELLSAGANPFGQDPEQWIERKLAGRVDPLPEITGLSRRQAKDLGQVLARAMARQREDRYPGPAEFARDLEAVLNDEPITLRPPSWIDLATRWWRHHRLAGVSLLVAALALLVGSLLSGWFAFIAQGERDIAMQEADKARAIVHFMESLFAASSPGLDSGPDVLARDLLEHGYARVDAELASQPQIAAALALSIARSYRNLGLYEQALALVDEDKPELGTRLNAERALLAGQIENFAGRYAQALERLSDLDESTLTANERSAVRNTMAIALLNLNRHDEAVRNAQAAIELADSSQTGLDLQLDAGGLLAAAAFARSDLEAAHSIYGRIHQLSEQRHGRVSQKTALALHNLGGVAFMRGDLDAAVSAYLGAVEAFEQYYGAEHRNVAMSLNFLGLSYRRQGKVELAETALRRSVQTWADWEGTTNAHYQNAVIQLLELLILDNRRDEARAILDEVPPLSSLDSPVDQGIDCRLSRLRQHIGNAGSNGDCITRLALPESVAVFDRFLDLATASARSDPIEPDPYAQLQARALALVPPDPLLVREIEKITPRP